MFCMAIGKTCSKVYTGDGGCASLSSSASPGAAAT
jgi:hypothetical protein